MPYIPLSVASHVNNRLKQFIRDIVDPVFAEVRFTLMVRDPNQGPRGSMQRPQAMLLMAAADGVSQFFEPDSSICNGGQRFKAFFKNSYPWHLDQPDGFSVDEAIDFLWSQVRCPLIHRLGVRAMAPCVHKYGNVFSLSDADLTEIERNKNLPHSEPSLSRDKSRTVLWIENFYWGIRTALANSVDTPAKAEAVDKWIASGKWQP
jgi:hypothetical protein